MRRFSIAFAARIQNVRMKMKTQTKISTSSLDGYFSMGIKELRALRGKFGPSGAKNWNQKLKVAFHQFHPIGLLEEWGKCKILAFFFTLPLL